MLVDCTILLLPIDDDDYDDGVWCLVFAVWRVVITWELFGLFMLMCGVAQKYGTIRFTCKTFDNPYFKMHGIWFPSALLYLECTHLGFSLEF